MKTVLCKAWLLPSILVFWAPSFIRAADDLDESKKMAIEGVGLSEIETIRRQESLIRGQQLIHEAQVAQSRHDCQRALDLYQDAQRVLVNAPLSATELQAVRAGSVECLLELSRAAYREKNFTVASDFARRVSEIDSDNKEAQSLLERAMRAQEGVEGKQARANQEVAQIPKEISDKDFVAKQKRVLELYRAAENYQKSEQFDQAEAALKDVLRIDPYSAAAYHRLREVQQSKFKKLDAAHQQTETEALLDVQNGWRLPLRRDKTSIKRISSSDEGLEVGGSKTDILNKLNSIMIKKIEFTDTPIIAAINFLMEESRVADPSHQGINIIPTFQKGIAPSASSPPAAEGGAAPGAPAEAAAQPVDATSAAMPKVTLNIRNVSLLQAIRYLTDVTGLKYRVDTDAVKIVSGDALEGQVQSRSYSIKPSLFRTFVEAPSGGGGGGKGGGGFSKVMGQGSDVKSETDAKKFLEEFGIVFKERTSAKYVESLGLLVVTHTGEVLEQIEEILLKLNKTSPQVQIEAKFIDVKQSDLEELGFKWRFAPSTQNQYTVESGQGTTLPNIPIGGPYRGLGGELTSGLRNAATVSASALDALLSGGGGSLIGPGANTIMTITGVLTNPQVQVMIDALAQKGLTNLLSAPRVTTVSGQSAKILVTREFIYPSTYTDPVVQAGTSSSTGGSGSVGITAPSPSGWTTREVGVILDVKPEVNSDDNLTINLTLSPEVTDFEGFINYNTYAVANGLSFVFTIPQPIFNKRQITTSVIIWDGQTVVLGGLIREDSSKINDKIPFLGDIPWVGRFFQSKVDSSVKRNLLIFLTARIVDPAGNPVRKFDEARVAAAGAENP